MKLNNLTPRICIALVVALIAAPTFTAMGGETTTPLETAIESLEENTKDNITENMHDDVIDQEISTEASSETPESKDSPAKNQNPNSVEDTPVASASNAEYEDKTDTEEDIPVASPAEATYSEAEYTVSTLAFTEEGLLILPRPVKHLFRFIEWNEKEDGSGKGYKAGTAIDPTGITLFSIWESESEQKEKTETFPFDIEEDTELLNDIPEDPEISNIKEEQNE